MPKTFTEEELQAQLKAERDRITAEKNAEFAEQKRMADAATEAARAVDAKRLADIETAKADVEAKVEAKFAEKERQMKADAHKKEIVEFIGNGVTAGKILPAWEKMGLAQFMEALPAEKIVTFGEGDGAVEQTPYGFFKAFMAELPKIVNFAEFATRDKDASALNNAGDKLTKIAHEFMEKDPKLTWGDAFQKAQVANPALVTEYIQEMRSAN